MTRNRRAKGYGVDANGCLTEDIEMTGGTVRVHYDDIPESDTTTVRGLRVTTALRTVIDLAAELSGTELDQMLQSSLDRGLFTVEDAFARLDQPDMANRPGARILRRRLRRP